MKTEDVSAFVSVAEQLSFGRTAAALGVAPSTVSRRVAALEGQLAVRLFARAPSGVSLTPAGIAFLEHAPLVLAATDEAVTAVVAAVPGPATID